NERIEAMAPTMEVFAMLSFRWPNGERATRAVRLVGVDPKSRGLLGGFKEHLINQKNNAQASFALSEEVRRKYEDDFQLQQMRQRALTPFNPNDLPPIEPPPSQVKMPCGVIVGDLTASFRAKHMPDESGTTTKSY